MRQVFGEAYAPLPAQMGNVISDPTDIERVARLYLGACVPDEAADEDFAEDDCRRASRQQRKAARVPLWLIQTAADVHYRAKEGALVAEFTDGLRDTIDCTDPGLTVWKPKMPAAPPKTCEPTALGKVCSEPYILPRTYKQLRFKAPMEREAARRWKAAERAKDASNEEEALDAPVSGTVTWLVSIRADGIWKQKYNSHEPGGEPVVRCLAGSLVRVHGLKVEMGNYSWQHPSRWPPVLDDGKEADGGRPDDAPALPAEGGPGGRDTISNTSGSRPDGASTPASTP